jgi:hypothetical protein
MLVNAQPVLGVLDMYRLIWISGRFGGHKTALAFEIAKRYLDKGYSLATNSSCIWADDLDQITLGDNNKLHAVCILDEGGLYFKSGRQVEQIAAYAAKMDVIYIIPSFWPPTKAAQVVNIQPIISLKATGLPIIIYKWRVSIGGFKENGWFFWWNPAEIYGVYSRQDPGEDPDEIIDWLTRRSNEFRSRYGRSTRDDIFSLAEISEGDQIMEGAAIMAEAAEDLGTALSGRRNKRRR